MAKIRFSPWLIDQPTRWTSLHNFLTETTAVCP